MAVSPGQVEDCVFYGEDVASATWSNLVTDLSGEATDLTGVIGGGATEDPSSRSNLTTTRSVTYRGDIDATDTGVMWRWERSGSHSSMRLDGTGDIDITTDSGASTESYTILNLSGTEDLVITWTMELNPDTLGFGPDALRSELHVYNLDQSTYELHTWTHAVEASDAAGALFFGVEDTGGTDLITADTFAIGMSSAFHSSDETYQTFVTQSSTPTLIGAEFRPQPMPARGDVAIGDDGHMAGPILMLGAKAAQQHRMLLGGPTVNALTNDVDFVDSDTGGATRIWGLVSPRGDSYRMEFLFYRPIHPAATHVYPRVYVQHSPSGTPDDLVVYVYSMNAPGPIVKPAASPEQFIPYWSTVTRSDDDGTGLTGGDWMDLDKIRISRDNSGWSYFCVGLDIDYAATSEARVKAVTLDPVIVYEAGSMGVGGFG